MYDNLVLGKGSLTDNIYIGTLKLNKRDITQDFLKVAIERWNGYKEIIQVGDKKYEIYCREIKEEGK